MYLIAPMTFHALPAESTQYGYLGLESTKKSEERRKGVCVTVALGIKHLSIPAPHVPLGMRYMLPQSIPPRSLLLTSSSAFISLSAWFPSTHLGCWVSSLDPIDSQVPQSQRLRKARSPKAFDSRYLR